MDNVNERNQVTLACVTFDTSLSFVSNITAVVSRSMKLWGSWKFQMKILRLPAVHATNVIKMKSKVPKAKSNFTVPPREESPHYHLSSINLPRSVHSLARPRANLPRKNYGTC